MEFRSPVRLILYETPWCPFCIRVRHVIRELGVQVESRDVRQPEARAELVRARGRGTVPVLRIVRPGRDEWMPESADIVSYLRREFAVVPG